MTAGNLEWIDYASIKRIIGRGSYTLRTMRAASALFPEGTHPELAMIVIDDAAISEDCYWEAAQDALDHYGPDGMPAWWEGVAKSGMRFVGGVDPKRGGPFMMVPNPSEMGTRFVEPALRALGEGMVPVAFDMLLGFFINLSDSTLVDWALQLASGSGGQVGQTFILTPDDIAAHGFMTDSPHLVPGLLLVGPYGTCDISFEDIINGFDALLGAYLGKGLIAQDEAHAALRQLRAYADAHDAAFDSAGFEALPSTDVWKDKLLPNRQHNAALSIAVKLCP